MYQLKVDSENSDPLEVDFVITNKHFVIYEEKYDIKYMFSLDDAKKISDFLNFAVSQQD